MLVRITNAVSILLFIFHEFGFIYFFKVGQQPNRGSNDIVTVINPDCHRNTGQCFSNYQLVFADRTTGLIRYQALPLLSS